MTILQDILQRLRTILVDNKTHYALHEPLFLGNESAYVQECLQTGWVSSAGSYVHRFEKQLAEFTGVQSAVAVVNGTAALHTCLLVAGVEPDDEVLVPTLTFVATANAVRYCHAVPHFVDINRSTLGVCPKKLSDYLDSIAVVKNNTCYHAATGRRISALCVAHILGHPAELDELLSICERFHITLIEDAAEALGSYYQGRHVGSLSLVAALSFNGNKIITTGGGGAILTNDPLLEQRVRHLTTTARVQHQWRFVHDQVGYNYRMPNINAALGCAQLEQLAMYLSKKKALARDYQKAFSDLETVAVFQAPDGTESNYWLNALILKDPNYKLRDRILAALHEQHIFSRPIWELLHRLPMYTQSPRMDVSHAEDLWQRMILLPSSPGIFNA